MSKLTRDDFVRILAKRLNKSLKETKEIEDTLEETLIEIWESNDELYLHGFGTFYAKVMQAREAKNPKTGEKVMVGKTVSPKFKAGKALKNILSKN